jgi:hypothetical protein
MQNPATPNQEIASINPAVVHRGVQKVLGFQKQLVVSDSETGKVGAYRDAKFPSWEGMVLMRPGLSLM